MAEEHKTVPPWKVLESKYSYRDRWLTLRSDTVELPNGRVLSPFHVIEQPDWSTAIALTWDGNVVLVEEYRHGAAETVIELPSGIIEGPGEPVEHMKRELLEETGFASDEWHPLGSFFANAPRLNNRVHCFVALDARKVAEPKLEDSEVIVTHEVPFDRFLQELRDGSRTFHGFQVGTMWLLHTFARRTRDERLAAILS
ncbi:NUDIX hydrolase [Reyranella aquatilis]|uniref:GDP-mannose pyrophosphatase n=1 Tax=Reyranella aquatilis TaxID=2035356 RepID=A0ABS8KYS0_9HYPH|nr:NUDIX hydrolase [Reyranella aquatilis]MCC8431246.1 NUDIX hydrolase [Reyranella aquatilis]